MKAFYVMFVVFAVLLLGVPIASAQDGSPSCSGGSAYDLTGHGCVTGYTNGSAAAASIAPKVAGLAAPAQAAQQSQGWSGCPWGDAYDPMVHGFIAECFWRPTDNAAALKSAGLAAPASIPEQDSPCVPWGDVYDPTMMLSHGPDCVSRPADNAAAPKTAGLAKLAPVEKFVPCGVGQNLDPLLDPQALACLSQPIPAAKAASKPAGLAAPAPAVIPEQGWSGCPWGATYDPMVQGYVPACFSRPTDNAAALKPAGLAKLTPVEGFVSCGAGENLDPLLDPLALACLSQPFPAAKAASKPAGLAAPAPAQVKFGPCGASGESPDPLTLACLR
jgi:hypothetical protein